MTTAFPIPLDEVHILQNLMTAPSGRIVEVLEKGEHLLGMLSSIPTEPQMNPNKILVQLSGDAIGTIHYVEYLPSSGLDVSDRSKLAVKTLSLGDIAHSHEKIMGMLYTIEGHQNSPTFMWCQYKSMFGWLCVANGNNTYNVGQFQITLPVSIKLGDAVLLTKVDDYKP